MTHQEFNIKQIKYKIFQQEISNPMDQLESLVQSQASQEVYSYNKQINPLLRQKWTVSNENQFISFVSLGLNQNQENKQIQQVGMQIKGMLNSIGSQPMKEPISAVLKLFLAINYIQTSLQNEEVNVQRSDNNPQLSNLLFEDIELQQSEVINLPKSQMGLIHDSFSQSTDECKDDKVELPILDMLLNQLHALKKDVIFAKLNLQELEYGIPNRKIAISIDIEGKRAPRSKKNLYLELPLEYGSILVIDPIILTRSEGTNQLFISKLSQQILEKKIVLLSKQLEQKDSDLILYKQQLDQKVSDWNSQEVFIQNQMLKQKIQELENELSKFKNYPQNKNHSYSLSQEKQSLKPTSVQKTLLYNIMRNDSLDKNLKNNKHQKATSQLLERRPLHLTYSEFTNEYGTQFKFSQATGNRTARESPVNSSLQQSDYFFGKKLHHATNVQEKIIELLKKQMKS